jgi:hypothetical protein
MRAYQIHIREVPDSLAVAGRAGDRGIASNGIGQSVRAGREHKRSHQSLDVPFPRRGERLVQVVDVEHESPFGRGEAAEIQQVGVSA